MPKHRLSRRRRIAAAATVIAAGGVLIVAQNDAPAAATDPVGLNAAYEYLGWGDAQDPVAVMKATGLKQFTLAFLLAGQGCDPRWDGSRPLTGGDDQAKIKAIRAAGGEAVASFGGWDGAKLGEKCADSTQLAAAYQKVIDAYQLKAIDIDIESTELTSADARQRVVEALGAVKAKNPGLRVYVTFSTELNGPDADGADLIARAAKARVEVDGWVVMPFDFDSHPGTMVDATVSALTGLQQALVHAYGYDADTAWRHTGLSSINGHSDSKDEVVGPADFRAMRDFAAAHHLARFTYWAVNRDRPCGGEFTAESASVCGGIQQDPYAFTRIVAGYHVDSTPGGPVGTSSHCPDPEPANPDPATGVTTTAKPAADGGPPAPTGTRKQTRRAATEATAATGMPADDHQPPESGASPSPTATRQQERRAASTATATAGEPAGPTDDGSDGPTASPSASRTKHGTPRATASAASPTESRATSTRTAPATPTADCTTVSAPAPGPTTPTGTGTGTGNGTAQPSRTPAPTATATAPASDTDPAPTDEPTTALPAPTPTQSSAPTTSPSPAAPAPAPTTEAASGTASGTGSGTGQALAHTGGGDATGILMEGADALLLLGGAFGMVGTRRRREGERAR
ncbi:hypothetical protein ACFXPX_24465 [Kitasatospora sp. NPDC059146]|uniref:hypothetical protein n=1 Tax=Kitasatospora sp. NPDC059146 TaxID=3346741 RepID=UPI00369B144E